MTIADDLFFYDVPTAKASRLTTASGLEEEATFSPDGQFVAFVRANNLYAVDVATQKERALTSDGGREILNGKLDWLYQEEIYGRDRFRAYWWSPDSARVAFLQLDERPVPEYTVVDHIPYRPSLEVTDYPKAGDPNPAVKLGVAKVGGGAPVWIDLAAYSSADPLIVNVDWTPDARHVVNQIQDREQTWLDLNLADADTGRVRTLLRETTKAWVNENGNPVWLNDGSFLWFSERSGFKHLYRVGADGAVRNQVTSGRWDVRTLYGVDQAGGLVYFSASERSPLGTDIYRIRLDGSGLTRLSQVDGTHRAIFNPAFTLFADMWSNVTTPIAGAAAPQQRRLRSPGHRPQPGGSVSRLSTVRARVRSGQDTRRLRHGRDDDQAGRFQSLAAISRLPVHLRRAGCLTGQEPMGRPRVHVSPDARAAWGHRLGARQQKRERQRRRITVAGLRKAWRARAAGPGGRRRMAEEAALRRFHAHGPERLELRRLHDGVCA